MLWLQRLFQFREAADRDTVQPFLDHLEELRWTIIRMGIVQAVTTALALAFRKELVHLLSVPLSALDPVPQLMTIGIADSLTISLELAFFAGLGLALPYHVHAIAGFILPALTRRERGLLLPGIGVGFLLFLGGVGVAYGYILPTTLEFFWKDAREFFHPQWTWSAYFSFASWLCFGFGAMCEIPMVVVLLSMLGFVSHGLLRRTRPYAYTGILVLAAIIAPSPDPVVLLTLAFPIVLLYEACIGVVGFLERRGWNADLIVGMLAVWWWRQRGATRVRPA